MSNAQTKVSHALRIARDCSVLAWCADTKGATALPNTGEAMQALREEFYALDWETQEFWRQRPDEALIDAARMYLDTTQIDMETAVLAHSDMIRGAILSVIPSLDYNDVDELEAEVALRAWEKRDLFNPEKAQIQTWLHDVATSVSKNQLARESAGRRPDIVFAVELPMFGEEEEILEYYDAHGDHAPSAEAVASMQQTQSALAAAPLSQREAELFDLHYEQGMKLAQIGEQWGVTLGTVTQTLDRMKKKLGWLS